MIDTNIYSGIVRDYTVLGELIVKNKDGRVIFVEGCNTPLKPILGSSVDYNILEEKKNHSWAKVTDAEKFIPEIPLTNHNLKFGTIARIGNRGDFLLFDNKMPIIYDKKRIDTNIDIGDIVCYELHENDGKKFKFAEKKDIFSDTNLDECVIIDEFSDKLFSLYNSTSFRDTSVKDLYQGIVASINSESESRNYSKLQDKLSNTHSWFKNNDVKCCLGGKEYYKHLANIKAFNAIMSTYSK